MSWLPLLAIPSPLARSRRSIENSIVGRLRSLEPSTVNLARGGNGPLAELATIREYLTAFEPEIVIWFYYRNDLEQNHNRERGDPVLSRYTEPDFTQDLAADPEGFAAAFRQAYIEKALAQKDPPPVLPTTDEKPGWLERLQFGQGANPLNNLSFLTLRRTRTSLGLVKGGGDWPDPLEQPMKNIFCCLHDGFNGTVGLSLSQVFLESVSEDGQLAIGLEADGRFSGPPAGRRRSI